LPVVKVATVTVLAVRVRSIIVIEGRVTTVTVEIGSGSGGVGGAVPAAISGVLAITVKVGCFISTVVTDGAVVIGATISEIVCHPAFTISKFTDFIDFTVTLVSEADARDVIKTSGGGESRTTVPFLHSLGGRMVSTIIGLTKASVFTQRITRATASASGGTSASSTISRTSATAPAAGIETVFTSATEIIFRARKTVVKLGKGEIAGNVFNAAKGEAVVFGVASVGVSVDVGRASGKIEGVTGIITTLSGRPVAGGSAATGERAGRITFSSINWPPRRMVPEVVGVGGGGGVGGVGVVV
jgi:hypothetical protein